ncbi:DNA helicase/exodeoxyribonuclease V beta subunit [Pasteurella langaaensis DSM 22999]|uniref:RecBCD enzyme subunit RecB n=1 Tax=Alitibacter langaaensis DSM 22999 TaxID=1122935 RepID=A0A2U0SKP3_9PAST|nr:exodeoxyribonuclease V subunit beta [Pasteurella langaaensis]PVX31902.1 DNA helicase/exodeoxyribonuclease V beta subunit [Pasteurella langaaensis DSM 22999]
MSKTTALQAISTPLTSVTLIEASAGTGKTFTMASLYLRLLLNIGENEFGRPLNVNEILVVTFTEAATQELKARIRQRIQQAKNQFIDYQKTKELAIFADSDNRFLVQDPETETLTARYLEQLDLDIAIQQLKFAEQNMDLAAIYTIHSFCHRTLKQYAVNSGIHFNLELVTNETTLLTQLTNAFWREYFYPQPIEVAQFIAQHLQSPAVLLNTLRPYLTGETPKLASNRPHLLTMSLQEFLQNEIGAKQRELREVSDKVKAQWQQHFAQIKALFLNEFEKESVGLNANKFKRPYFDNRVAAIEHWCTFGTDFIPPNELWCFTKSYIDGAFKKGFEAFQHDLFDWLEEQEEYFKTASESIQQDKMWLLFHCAKVLNERLNAHKESHIQKGFNDLLRLLKQALTSESGEQLADLIRHQYPFAMIDEFQDTDEQQYAIFSHIYVNKPDCGFMMIGDPKQAIYKFRGADIFTYLKAAEMAGEQRFTLNKNYRSTPELIHAVNELLDFDTAFLYDKIQFDAVKAGKNQPHFVLNGEKQAPLHFYVEQERSSDDDIAECCAENILHWLESADKNLAVFDDDGKQKPLQSDDIAVLVRTGTQAEKIQQALRKRGIASVYLSDRSDVFCTEIARELVHILSACLNATNEHAILNAVSTSIYALSAAEIQKIKQSEALLERWAERFESYFRTWKFQGVLPMLYQLLLDKGEQSAELSIPEKILALPNGERRLTDLLHLAELLQQAAPLNESEAALLRWFERQVQGGDESQQGESQVRLESEQKLVKIVTIHKSKGLEYGLVWLPFLHKNIGDNRRNNEISTYHNEQDETLWDIEEQHKEESEKEQFAEEMRLIYVALTRAKYHLSIVVPQMFTDWNGWLYVLTRGEIGMKKKIDGKRNGADLASQIQKQLNQKLGENSCQISALSASSDLRQLDLKVDSQNIAAAEFTQSIEQNWGITSFTALERMHSNKLARYRSLNEQGGLLEMTKNDDDDGRSIIETTVENQALWVEFSQGLSPLDFPRGRMQGTALHRLFEKQQFDQPIDPQIIAETCHKLQLEDEWNEALQRWITQVLHTPIDGVALAELPAQDVLKEMQFMLKIDRTFDVKAFNAALEQHHPLYQQPYQFDEIQGMVRGAIDLVYRHHGQYYLLDYKSNALADYRPEALAADIQQHHYDLQYLIYSIALHRYLQQKLPNYDYEKDFGGVRYAYLRGMNGSGKTGVFADKPCYALIQALEKLFYA